MNSFISSFRLEFKVVAALVCLLVTIEVGARCLGGNLSKEIKHIEAIPQLLEGLRKSNGERILFLGNSLTREGVDLQLFRRLWSEHSEPAATFQALYPNDTAIGDWYYLYRYDIGARQVPVDLLVVGFVGNQLRDTRQLRLDLLGGYFGGLSILREAFNYDIRTTDDRVDFLVNCLSKTYANRDLIKRRILDVIIPYYRNSAQVINKSINLRLQKSFNNTPTYERVKRLLAAAASHKTTLVLVAMPLPYPYEIDNTLREAIHAGGGILLDCREIKDLKSSDYSDGLHLAPYGAQIYSTRLFQEIVSNPELQKRLGVRKVDATQPPEN